MLTGHTADDRAETMLINLLRGTGLDGLTALGPEPGRPLLGLRRHETRELCRHLGLTPVEDPTNDDRRFVRNRVRHELLPLMDAIAGRDVVPLLVRTAEVAADDLALAEAHAERPRSDRRPRPHRGRPGSGPGAPCVAGWRRGGYPPDAATVTRVLRVATGEHRACEIAGGRRVERHAQRLRIVSGGPLMSHDG